MEPARAITGIDNKKEKRAAAVRVMPNINPTIMVEPDREVPGIKARA